MAPREQIQIPRTIKQAERQLGSLDKEVNSLDGLMTARNWQRAFTVRAFTCEGKGGPRTAREVVQLSIRQFTELGILGLRSQDSVRRYRQAVQELIDAGQAVEPKPGDTVDIPDMPFPATRSGTDGYSTEQGAVDTVKRIVEKHGPWVPQQAISQAINNDLNERYPHRQGPREPRRPSPPEDDGSTSNTALAAVLVGIEISINNARRNIRQATQTLDSQHIKLTKEYREGYREHLDNLKADIEMLEAVITNQVDEDELRAFLQEGV